jgi:hypothetical protein
MSTDPRDRLANPRPDIDPAATPHGDVSESVLVSDATGHGAKPVEDLPEPTVVQTSEPLPSVIDGAGRPDKVAIGMMVGVVVLLLICVAFAFAAR